MARIIEPSEYESKDWKCGEDEYIAKKRCGNCDEKIILGICIGESVVDALDSEFGREAECGNCGFYAFRTIPSLGKNKRHSYNILLSRKQEKRAL